MKEPKLPEPVRPWATYPQEFYTAEQMRAAILAERDRCAGLCDNVARYYTPHYELGAKECAAAIRKG